MKWQMDINDCPRDERIDMCCQTEAEVEREVQEGEMGIKRGKKQMEKHAERGGR